MKNIRVLLNLAFCLAVIAGCSAATSPTSGLSLVDQSAAEATAIIQRAQSTAMVLQAQIQATAMIQSAGLPASAPTSTLTFQKTPENKSAILTPVSHEILPQESPDTAEVKLLRVGFGAEGTYICVEFTAVPSLTRNWQQGNLSVTDEATGVVYDNIPVMPILGALLGRPKYAGQTGYVMFVNTPPGLKTGTLVTVVLGNFKQEHVVVQR